MRKWLQLAAAAALVAVLTVPAWAQPGKGQTKAKSHGKAAATASATPLQAQTRSNKGGEVRGQTRAAEVQTLNTKADSKRGFTTSKGLTKSSAKAHVKHSKKHRKS